MTPETMRADAVDPGWKWPYRVAGGFRVTRQRFL